ncbi:MAG: bestrophin family ion channel, partial [Bacteroidota bacterium]
MLLRRNIPVRYLFEMIKIEWLYVFAIGFTAHYLTHTFREFIPEMPLAIPLFLGTAISVLLSFKLNQSYERWWEARKIWGAIVNDSRNLVLQLQTLVAKGNDEVVNKIALRQIAWCYSLGQSLRDRNATDNIIEFLSDEDFTSIQSHSNKPLAMLQMQAKDVADLKEKQQTEVFTLVQINTTLVNLTNSMGMAERIKTTVFPITYRIFLHLIIYLFVITLSISLLDIKSYFEIPLLLILSTGFFLLEKSATEMQD